MTGLDRCFAASLAVVALATACGADRAPADPSTTDAEPSATTIDTGDDAPVEPGRLWPTEPGALDPTAPASWTVEIVARIPHDETAFTQGLELLDADTLIESTGLRGESTIRLVDLATGEASVQADLADAEFGEGLTVVDDIVIQLTWQQEIAHRWRLPDFEPLEPFTYVGEGWGICASGDRLVMSNGSDQLAWRDPTTFVELRSVAVTVEGQPVSRLNELECVDGSVIANVWMTDFLVVIAADGSVRATIDAGALVAEVDVDNPTRDVLNGIADLGDGTLLLGGKNWPTFFRVRLVPT